MELLLRVLLLLLALGVTWYLNYEKIRFLKIQEKSYEDKNERLIGEYGSKIKQYANYVGFMSFVDFFLLVYVLAGDSLFQ